MRRRHELRKHHNTELFKKGVGVGEPGYKA